MIIFSICFHSKLSHHLDDLANILEIITYCTSDVFTSGQIDKYHYSILRYRRHFLKYVVEENREDRITEITYEYILEKQDKMKVKKSISSSRQTEK